MAQSTSNSRQSTVEVLKITIGSSKGTMIPFRDVQPYTTPLGDKVWRTIRTTYNLDKTGCSLPPPQEREYYTKDTLIYGGQPMRILCRQSSFSGAEGDTTKPTPAIMQNLPHILGSAGFLGGLYYAFTQKSGFWGYVGWSLLGSIAGGVAGGIIKEVTYPSSAKVVSEEKTTTTTTVTKK